MVTVESKSEARHQLASTSHVVASQFALLIRNPFVSSTGSLFQCRQHGNHSVKIRRPTHRNFERIIMDPALFSVTFPPHPPRH